MEQTGVDPAGRAGEAASGSATGAVSSPEIVALARRLRGTCRGLEAAVWLAVTGSVAAIGAVHPWAYVPLWAVAAIAVALAWRRAVGVRRLRSRLGSLRISFHSSERWLVLGERARWGRGWSFDLGRPPWPPVPLLLPGLALLGWTLLELVPLPPGLVHVLSPGRPALLPDRPGAWLALTVSAADTLRGVAFVAAALAMHAAAAAAFDDTLARKRLRRGLAGLVALLGLVAFAQVAAGTTRIYGVFTPDEGLQAVFGPFVNRDHFAAYMLLAVPVALGVAAAAYGRYAQRVGAGANLRRRLVVLASREGRAFLRAAAPAAVSLAALVASGSRPALAAFAAGLALAAVHARRGAPAALASAVALVVAVGWWMAGVPAGGSVARAPDDARLRLAIWRDAVRPVHGLWVAGSGLDTFAWAVSRSHPWRLPRGATPWRPEGDDAAVTGARVAFHVPEGVRGLGWYREAHNDYLQLLVETGVPGLLAGLWAAAAALVWARRDPWLLAAVAGLLLHEAVAFGVQIPAIAVLLAVLLYARAEREGRAAVSA